MRDAALRHDLAAALRDGAAMIDGARAPDGFWEGAMPPGVLHLGTSLLASAAWSADPAELEAASRDLESRRLSDGTFALYSGGPSDENATRLAALALRRPVPAPSGNGDPLLRWTVDACAAAIGAAERGVPAADRLAKYFLSSGLTWRLRESVARAVLETLPALGVLLARAAEQSGPFRWLARLAAPSGVDARRDLRRRILAGQNPDGSWAWTVLGTSLSLLALKVLGEARESPAVRRGLAWLQDRRRRGSWTASRVWDTALALDLLLFLRQGKGAADFDASAFRLREAQRADGCWSFDPGQSLPDHDSTAVTLACLSRYVVAARLREDPGWSECLLRGLKALLDGMLSDGGWGFAPGRPLRSFGPRPPSTPAATLFDAGSADLSARVLLALVAVRQTGLLPWETLMRVDAAIRRAVVGLRRLQGEDGLWWSRWSAGRLPATAAALLALRGSGLDPGLPGIRRARQAVLEARRPDGGWEEPLSFTEPATHPSSAATASGLLALLASREHPDISGDPALLESIRRLLSRGGEGSYYPFAFDRDYYEAPFYTRMGALRALAYAQRCLERQVPRATEELTRPVVPWSRPQRAPGRRMEIEETYLRYREIGKQLAGETDSVPLRVAAHYLVYRKSNRNFTFPLLALHGAAWAREHFLRLQPLVAPYVFVRHPFDSKRRGELRANIQKTMMGLKLANQRVLLDTYANYRFTRDFGRLGERLIEGPVVGLLERIHRAEATGVPLTNPEKGQIYSAAFAWEQTNSVWPVVKKTLDELKDPLVRAIAFKPIVRFAYFPASQFLYFSDFGKTEERIEEGWKAYRLAERSGWTWVARAILLYRILPKTVLEDPEASVRRLSGWSGPLF